MNVKEYVSLAPLTTLGVGGKARFFIEVRDEADIDHARKRAREQKVPLFVLGGGSNVLIPDATIEGVVLRVMLQGIKITEKGDNVFVCAGAGVSWNKIVDGVGGRDVYGIENLAGIPGSLGGAVVQNIGAYGAEFSTVFDYANVVHAETGERAQITHADADFAYRTSYFKKHPELIITQVALRLSKSVRPDRSYPDVVKAHAAGVPLSTPAEIARAIRAIRAKKFPHSPGEGTAGSFFKNPIVPSEQYASLAKQFRGLPAYPQEGGMVKLPLAWLLDHALHLKGHAIGPVRLYEKQPLVIVARVGATASDINTFARDIERRVFETTGLTIEREVEMFGARI